MKIPKPSNKRSSLLISLVLMGLAGSLHADNIPLVDDYYSIQGWMVDDGLPKNTITSITQTPDGFIWLGTPFSLIRFDGVEFREYGLEPGNQIDIVRTITSNDSGELYLAPRNQALTKFTKGNFKPLIKAEDSQFNFHCVTTGPDNTVWAIDVEGVIYKVVDEELLRVVVIEEDFKHDVLFDLDVAQDGTIWFSRGEFYGYYRPGQQPKVWRLNNEFIRLSLSKDGTVWMLTKNELRQLISDESGESERVVTLPVTATWSKYMEVDSRNRIWMAVRGEGLFLWENDKLKQFENIPNRFWSLFEDKDGSIWIGLEGSGLYQIRDKLFQIIDPSGKPSDSHTSSVHKNLFADSSNRIFQITDDNFFEPLKEISNYDVLITAWEETDNSFWAGSSQGRVYHFHEGRVQEYQIDSSSQQIRLLFMDSKKNLWAGGFDWGLSKLPYPYESIERVLSDNRQNFNVLVELPTGQIIAGSRSGNVFCFDEEKVWEFSRESGLKGSSILSLLYTSTGHLLAGTAGHGLAVLDDDKFHHISTEQGLYDPVVSQMVEDDFGFLWIGSTRGIFRIDLSNVEAWLNDPTKTVTSIVYGKTHGLSNIEVISDYKPGASRASNGIIEFATNKGVVRVDPEDIAFTNSKPNAVIDSVQIDDLKLPGNKPIRIRSGFHRLSINYTAPSFISPESILFRCSMEGFDNDWVNMGKERSIRYPRLPPGDYSFKISASDQNGKWSGNYATIALFVVPRWWETILARATFLILFTGAIGFIVRMILVRRMRMIIERTRQEMMLERERTRISRDLHDNLGARLTEIAFMADLAPKNTENQSTDKSTCSSIAKRARKAVISLDETVWMVDPGKDVLEQFVPYVVQYSTEFCECSDLACRLNIPNSLPSVKLEGRTRHHLFLAFKEALNNVVRHADATLVKIGISCESNKLKISLSDNGKGLNLEEAESGQRHGIGNMRDRMGRIGGEFDILSNPENGTIITFTLTFNNKKCRKTNQV